MKLSEDPIENAQMLEKPMKERGYFELNALKAEPRFAEKPLYTAPTYASKWQKKSLDTLKEKPKLHRS